MEFRADFELTARRVLDATHLQIFFEHLVGEREWHEVNGRVGLDRGNFHHAVYRLEQMVGKELRRRGIYPVEEYMQMVCTPTPAQIAYGTNRSTGGGNYQISPARRGT
jgi:hypothetical protein